jgi:hypothetical protein
MIQIAIAAALVLAAFCAAAAAAGQPPVIPVGLDAYRQWERWPEQRIGIRAYMRSTYDRAGGNESADASHFLYQLADDFNVTLDVEGTGILYFARYNHWHGSPWHYVVDGRDTIVRESSTADPLHPVADSTFLPAELFPEPLAFTWSTTKGADLMWVPIGFERSFRMAYSRTCYGTGYYIYHLIPRCVKTSQPVTTWDARTPPSRDVLDLLARSGQRIDPRLPHSAPGWVPARELTADKATVPSDGAVVLANFRRAPAALRAIILRVPRAKARDLERVRIRITWDDRPQPSVEAPVPLFFGAGTLYNRDGREWLVKAFPVNIRFAGDAVELACYFPMPYFRSARVELVGTGGPAVENVSYEVISYACGNPPGSVGYFHATYRDHPAPEPGKDLVLLDTRETEGGGDWAGHFVGTSFIFTHKGVLTTLEGDPRFFFDDSLTPQAQGTGTEEWGGGGDYWGGRNMTLPLAGHPVGAKAPGAGPDDLVNSAYRFLLADLMPFGFRARIQLEHGGENQSTEHYETVTYWYGVNSPALLKTDELAVGDPESEKAHGYISPDASAPAEVTSRYELGPDHLAGKEIFPAHTDRGRVTTGTSEFTLRLDSGNLGVLLRRKLDYSYPNQRAEVSVADASAPGARPADADFRPAGIWYLAGSNTCVYSRPKGELDPTLHIVQTSNRRFRDDEFLIPRDLTAGRAAVRVRVRFTPVETPLFPGHPLAKLGWSEMRYTAYCYRMPEAK